MTLIHPDKQNFFLNIVLFAMLGLVSVALIWMIFLYNKTVSLAHAASDARETIKQTEASNSELRGQILALFDPDQVTRFAAERGLVSDRSPEYSPIISEWVVASQR